MSGVKKLVHGLIADLRARRLLPIAIVLVVALIAVPIALHKPAEPVPSAPAPDASSAPAGLPNQATAAPLVSMAALERSSDLGSFEPKNPFKPLRSLDGSSPSDVMEGDNPFAGAPGDPADQESAGAASSGSTLGAGATGAGGSVPTSSDDSTTAPTSPGSQPTDDNSRETRQTESERRFTYAADVTFSTPERRRGVRGLRRLSMLPSEASPLLVFLGVDDTGEDAVFLVDASLASAGGGGDCGPSKDDCATLTIAPGKRHSFTDATGGRYTIEIKRIRTVAVKSKSGPSSTDRWSNSKPSAGTSSTRRRFELPNLVDLLVDASR